MWGVGRQLPASSRDQHWRLSRGRLEIGSIYYTMSFKKWANSSSCSTSPGGDPQQAPLEARINETVNKVGDRLRLGNCSNITNI